MATLGRAGFLAAATGLALLAGCGPVPRASVTRSATPVPLPAPHVSAESLALSRHFAEVQAALLSQGLLRTDMGGADTPFTDRMLAEDFLAIAFNEEYDRALGGTVRRAAPIPLTRWEVPIRVQLNFGDSVPADRRATDTLRIDSYLARLSRLTGHSIRLADSDTNFAIFIADVDERRRLGPELKALLPDLTPAQTGSMTAMDRNTYCQVITESDPDRATYSAAAAVIPAEHPDLMWMACVHEEIAQALGLPNDSGLARPSIFNDDQEFALLTRADELLLKMLYSPALRPGMTASQARPIVEDLASRLTGGDS